MTDDNMFIVITNWDWGEADVEPFAREEDARQWASDLQRRGHEVYIYQQVARYKGVLNKREDAWINALRKYLRSWG